MKYIVSFLLSLLVSSDLVFAQTVPVPPNKVPQPDGTIQLVPVPPGFVYTPYFIDPARPFKILLETQHANKRQNGTTTNGQIGIKGDIVTVRLMAMPISAQKTLPDGKKVYLWSIYRSSDCIITWDNTRLEFVSASGTGFAFDNGVMNASKTGLIPHPLNEAIVPQDGNLMFHSEALPVPEKRTPAKAPQYYQWNFDGYMWQGAYRVLGELKFRIKDDYYFPVTQESFVRMVPSLTVNGVEYKSTVDGSPTIGTNVLTGGIESNGEAIRFGAPPTYKVTHYLTAESTKYKVGDTVPVQVKIKPESLPQIISSVATNFAWDINKLEFMGISGTGARPAQSSRMDMPGAGRINETSVPKDGNAWHNWLSRLGDKTYIDKETLIVTLNFKVVSDFNTTQVEIIKQNDPRLVGLWVPEESNVLGSNIPGNSVLGTQSGVTINGILP